MLYHNDAFDEELSWKVFGSYFWGSNYSRVHTWISKPIPIRIT